MELKSKMVAEIDAFEKDMDTPLEFVGNLAKMKDYYFKTLEIVDYNDGSGWYDLRVNGYDEANIVFNADYNKYSAYDGVDGYGWYDTIKQAVKSYMDYNYNYPTDEEEYGEVNCSNCGDDGCLYCEPYRFL